MDLCQSFCCFYVSVQLTFGPCISLYFFGVLWNNLKLSYSSARVFLIVKFFIECGWGAYGSFSFLMVIIIILT